MDRDLEMEGIVAKAQEIAIDTVRVRLTRDVAESIFDYCDDQLHQRGGPRRNSQGSVDRDADESLESYFMALLGPALIKKTFNKPLDFFVSKKKLDALGEDLTKNRPEDSFESQELFRSYLSIIDQIEARRR